MNEFTDDDLQLSIESDDDTRITLTLVSMSGKKITMAEFLLEIELYIKEVCEAEEERNKIGGASQ